jgi:dihydroorotase
LNEKILEKVGNWGKVNPPLRTDMDNVALWNAVHNGTVDTIGTDHAPHYIEEKQQEYSKAPSGFPGLETCLPLLLTEISSGFDINKIIELTSRNTAKIFGLEKNVGIKKGNYADLAVIDLNKKWTINASKFKTKAKYSPFDEVNVKGKIVMTFVNGRCYKFEE